MMTTTIPRHSLVEFKTTKGIALTPSERDAIKRLHPRLRIEPSMGVEGRYDLTPDQRIGMISLPTVVLEIRPKIPVSSVVFLVSYCCQLARWSDSEPDSAESPAIVEMMMMMLARVVTKATERGLLYGYHTEDEPLSFPRGRILFDDFIRRRNAKSPPIDVRHDVFSADVLENQLLLAALTSLKRFPISADIVRRHVGAATRRLGEVSLRSFSSGNVPDVVRTPLNAHYDSALTLASLVLRSMSADLGTGSVKAGAFLIDMNKVFEVFVRTAIREVLGVTRRELPDKSTDLWLDVDREVVLEPDLGLRDGQAIRWIADVKYKRLSDGEHQNQDLYQLLAYATALNLGGGTLIYATDHQVKPAVHVVKHSGKRLRIVGIDLSRAPTKLKQQVTALAHTLNQT